MTNITATYENIPAGSMQNSVTTGDHAVNYSAGFVDFNDFKTYRTVPKYATLEQDRCLLDGTFVNVPANPVGYGYCSNISTSWTGYFGEMFTQNITQITITRTYTNTYTAPRTYD